MKKLLAISALACLFSSCEKCDLFEKDDDACPVIITESVPQEVQQTYATSYSAYPAERWYNKDGTYVAEFKKDGDNHFAKFDSTGKFLKEFIEDDSEYESGCECEEEDDD